MTTTKALKVLIFEAACAEPEQLEKALGNGRLQVVSQRVDTTDRFFEALRAFAPDVVLISDILPNHDSPEVCARARRINPELPIVLVAGTVSDDTALALMMAGAKSYVLASNLQQLPAVVERAIDIEMGIRARKSAEQVTKTNEEWFHLLFENAPDAIVIYDADAHRFIDANAQAELLFGCDLAEITRHGPGHFYSPEQPDQKPVSDSVARHDALALAGERLVYERRIRRPNGEERTCVVSMVGLPSLTGHFLRGSFVDITERVRVEQDLKRTNRALRTLGQGNAVVVRSASERELLNDMCHVIVDEGGYRMAWIGEVQRDAGSTVRFLAWAGEGADRLASGLGISWAEGAAGNGPTGRAIRTGEPQTSQDVLADPSMAPWAEAAREYGIASGVTLPLNDRSGVFAVLRICATEPNAFDSAELSLLRELADDLSYGISTLRDRSKHALIEQRWRVGLEATIRAISSMVEMRDPYTSGHQQRVANLAVAIAHALGLSEDDTEGLISPASYMMWARLRFRPRSSTSRAGSPNWSMR